MSGEMVEALYALANLIVREHTYEVGQEPDGTGEVEYCGSCGALELPCEQLAAASDALQILEF